MRVVPKVPEEPGLLMGGKLPRPLWLELVCMGYEGILTYLCGVLADEALVVNSLPVVKLPPTVSLLF
jgi:hypothetical protein